MQNGRKVLITLPEDINHKVVQTQLKYEKETGERLLKPKAVIQYIRNLMEGK